MATFLQLFTLTFVLLLASVCSTTGSLVSEKNLKTNPNQLSLFDKLLFHTFHPNVPLNKILRNENAVKVNDVNDNTTIPKKYDEYVAWWFAELPLFILQLNKMGDKVLFPSFTYQDGLAFCEIECFGFFFSYRFVKPVFSNVDKASLTGSVNGTQLRLHFHVPDIQGHSPEFLYMDLEITQFPHDRSTWRNASIIMRNFSLILTADISMGDLGPQVSQLNLDWIVEELRVHCETGKHTYPNGTEEDLGQLDFLTHEGIWEYWEEDKEEVQADMQQWLNCFLSNGTNGDEDVCNSYLENRFHRQTFAELIHAFGLNGLNQIRTNSPPTLNAFFLENESSQNLLSEDPIRIIHEVLFDHATHVLQTGKLTSLESGQFKDRFEIERYFSFNFDKEVCASNGTDCYLVNERITLGKLLEDGDTEIYGILGNDAQIQVTPSNISYKLVVPRIGLSSSDYHRISTNLNTSVQYDYTGLQLKVVNSTVGISGDYEFANGHYSVSNVRVTLELGEVSMVVPGVKKRENGAWSDLEPIDKSVAPQVMELWKGTDESGVTLETRYSAFIEAKINDVLAGRSTM